MAKSSNGWFGNPQTVVGAIICLGGVVLTLINKDTLGITLIGIGGTWIGVTAKDAKK